jgi:hypothetical protein
MGGPQGRYGGCGGHKISFHCPEPNPKFPHLAAKSLYLLQKEAVPVQLTQRSWALPEKLPVVQLLNNFLTFYET